MDKSEFVDYSARKASQGNMQTEENLNAGLTKALRPSIRVLGSKVDQKQKERAERWTLYGMSFKEAYDLCREAPGRFKTDEEKIKYIFVDKYGRIRRDAGKDYLPYITRSRTKKILLCDINTIDYEEGHLIFSTVDGKECSMIGELTYIYQFLNRDFIHAAKKRIVNMRNVADSAGCTIIFENNKTCELCSSYFQQFRQGFNDYLTEK
ncbi:MAG: LytTR family transcriptional regulator DNA-binding domain-containing protein [Eubacterium sp.]